MFLKAGTLRAALALAREERMLDGQDPTAVLKRCSNAQLDATVQLEIELCVRGRSALRVEQHNPRIILVTAPKQDWPVLLKMYVSVRSLPIKNDVGLWPVYLFARRFTAEKDALTQFLARLSDKRLAYVLNVKRE
jgi:hypothetical protein